jgi:hypothetical protein
LDATVVARFGRLSVREQAETLRLARDLADFVWEQVGGFKLDDLNEQDKTVTEGPDAQQGDDRGPG